MPSDGPFGNSRGYFKLTSFVPESSENETRLLSSEHVLLASLLLSSRPTSSSDQSSKELSWRTSKFCPKLVRSQASRALARQRAFALRILERADSDDLVNFVRKRNKVCRPPMASAKPKDFDRQ